MSGAVSVDPTGFSTGPMPTISCLLHASNDSLAPPPISPPPATDRVCAQSVHAGGAAGERPQRLLRRARVVQRLPAAEVTGVLLDVAHTAVETVQLTERHALSGPAASTMLLTLGAVHHWCRRGALGGDSCRGQGVSEAEPGGGGGGRSATIRTDCIFNRHMTAETSLHASIQYCTG